LTEIWTVMGDGFNRAGVVPATLACVSRDIGEYQEVLKKVYTVLTVPEPK
jgi:hypothetical protein